VRPQPGPPSAAEMLFMQAALQASKMECVQQYQKRYYDRGMSPEWSGSSPRATGGDRSGDREKRRNFQTGTIWRGTAGGTGEADG